MQESTESFNGEDNEALNQRDVSSNALAKTQLSSTKLDSLLAVEETSWCNRQCLLNVFEAVVCGSVILNTAVIATDAEIRIGHGESTPTWIGVLDKICLVVYALEVVIRFFIFKERTIYQVLDAIVVIVGIVGEIVESGGAQSLLLLRFFKAFRVLRVIRVMRSLESARMLLEMMGDMTSILKLLVGGFIMYLLVTFIFALFGMEILHHQIIAKANEGAFEIYGGLEAPSVIAFSSLFHSFSSLFGLMVFSHWDEIAYPIFMVLPWSLVFFLLFMLCTVYGLVTLCNSAVILCAIIDCLNNRDKVSGRILKKRRAAYKEQLQMIFEMLDSDQSGWISYQEFFHCRTQNAQFIEIMEQLHIADEDLDVVWDLLDMNKDSKVDPHEFLEVMWRLQSDDTKWNVMQTAQLTRRLTVKVDRMEHAITSMESKLVKLDSMSGKLDKLDTALGLSSSSLTTSSFQRLDCIAEQVDETTKQEQSAEESLPLNDGTFSATSATGSRSALKAAETGVSSQGAQKQRMTKVMSGKPKAQKSRVSVMEVERNSNSLHRTSESKEHEADEYMRSLPAMSIATFGREQTLRFWSGQPVREDRLEITQCSKCDFFVSHSWIMPKDWSEHFSLGDGMGGSGNDKVLSYEYKKALQLNNSLQLVRRQRQIDSWETLACWVDRACIPQNDEKVKAACILLIEEFLKRSNGLIVLLSWTYFERLWCCYEWACFLVLHHPLEVEIGLDAFLKYHPDETLPLFLRSIENISVANCQCFRESDRRVLEEKVFQYYTGRKHTESFTAFERFAKYTALALIAKEIIMWRARVSREAETGWLQPLRNLAQRLGFTHLHLALSAATPSQWYLHECKQDIQQFELIVKAWVNQVIVPSLLHERNRAVRYMCVPELKEKQATMSIDSAEIRGSGSSKKTRSTFWGATRKTISGGNSRESASMSMPLRKRIKNAVGRHSKSSRSSGSSPSSKVPWKFKWGGNKQDTSTESSNQDAELSDEEIHSDSASSLGDCSQVPVTIDTRSITSVAEVGKGSENGPSETAAGSSSPAIWDDFITVMMKETDHNLTIEPQQKH